MSPTEYPTEEKIAQLREQGIVPLSSVSLKLAALLIMLSSIYLLFGDIYSELTQTLVAIVNGSSAAPALFSDVVSIFITAIIFPLVGVILGVFLLGLMQTKFLFRMEAIRFNLGRLWMSGSGEKNFFSSIISSIMRILLTIVVASVLSLGIVLVVSRELFVLFNLNTIDVAVFISRLIGSVFPIFVALLILAIVGSWLVSRYSFMMKHRMSRAEIDQELKAR